MLRKLLAVPMFLLAVTSAWAQDSAMCRNGLFSGEPPFALAEVSGADRVRFHEDVDGCPWSGEGCATKSYVVPGDKVVISKIRKGFACAFYPSKGGGTAGWISTRHLRLMFLDTNPPQEAWIGTWTSWGNPAIEIEDRLGGLYVTGEAFWPGPPGTHEWPSIHAGQLDGRIERSGQRGHYEDDNLCEVTFTLLGDYLIAGDNRQCGGANVSFSAVYLRAGG